MAECLLVPSRLSRGVGGHLTGQVVGGHPEAGHRGISASIDNGTAQGLLVATDSLRIPLGIGSASQLRSHSR